MARQRRRVARPVMSAVIFRPGPRRRHLAECVLFGTEEECRVLLDAHVGDERYQLSQASSAETAVEEYQVMQDALPPFMRG